MPLDPFLADGVAHLFDASIADILSGRVPGAPSAGPMHHPDVAATDMVAPGGDGDVPVRIYRRRDTATALRDRDGLPALVWLHGGGWRYGNLEMPEADSVAQVVAATLPGVVVSVDYRLAPTHRHPAAFDDAVSVFRWVVAEAAAHGVDPTRVALGGASAGGHLAAAAGVALSVGSVAPAALLLAYPVTDPVGGPYDDVRHPDCPPVLWLDRESVSSMFGQYLGADPATAGPPIVPGAADLGRLPPTLVTAAEADGLARQAGAFVDRAAAAGAIVAHHVVDRVLHGYLNVVGAARRADEALDDHVDWLRSVIGPTAR